MDKNELLGKFDDDYNSFVRLGRRIGPAALDEVLQEFGGQKPHIPTERNFYANLFREVRNAEIRAKFSGRNYEQLGLEYGLCEKQVRIIVDSQRKEYAKPKGVHHTVKISGEHHEELAQMADRYNCTMHHVVSVLLDVAMESPEVADRLRETFGERGSLLEDCA